MTLVYLSIPLPHKYAYLYMICVLFWYIQTLTHCHLCSLYCLSTPGGETKLDITWTGSRENWNDREEQPVYSPVTSALYIRIWRPYIRHSIIYNNIIIYISNTFCSPSKTIYFYRCTICLNSFWPWVDLSFVILIVRKFLIWNFSLILMRLRIKSLYFT